MEKVVKVVYVHSEEDVEVVAEVLTNQSLSVEAALEVAGVDMDQYAEAQGWEGYDPNALRLEV